MIRRSASPARRSRPPAIRHGRRITSGASRPRIRSARKARLAFALLLYTGQRRSDVVKMGRQHIHNGVLTIDQGKTEGGEEAHLEIPVHPKLREIIDATPTVGVKTFLVTHFGKPYTAPGFGNWFRELCDAAGLSRRVGTRAAQGDGATARRDRMQREPDRSDHRPRVAFRGATLHEGRRPQAHGARGDGEARRGRMVNRSLSSIGIMLDNFGAKALRSNNPNQRVVGPGEVATL